MGGCQSSSDFSSASSSSDVTPQRGGGGRQTGGAAGVPDDPREAMRAAALARAEKNMPGLEKAAKAELIGKLTELYHKSGKGPPFNLGALPLDKLRRLYVEMGGRN
jgi:hypothetical protein